jgi:hypothetical protein
MSLAPSATFPRTWFLTGSYTVCLLLAQHSGWDWTEGGTVSRCQDFLLLIQLLHRYGLDLLLCTGHFQFCPSTVQPALGTRQLLVSAGIGIALEGSPQEPDRHNLPEDGPRAKAEGAAHRGRHLSKNGPDSLLLALHKHSPGFWKANGWSTSSAAQWAQVV